MLRNTICISYLISKTDINNSPRFFNTTANFLTRKKNNFRLKMGIQKLVTFMNLLETYTVLATFLHFPICNFYVLNIHVHTMVSEVPVILFTYLCSLYRVSVSTGCISVNVYVLL